jgi:FkbM family methyltransferase
VNRIWSILLKPAALRKRIMAHLRADFFHEFGHSIPLGNDYWAELLENDAYDSFSEIFIQQEYADYLPSEPLSRILDIGAHYGYFSLWIQSKYPEREIHSLMIEPSPRCKKSLQRMVNNLKLGGRFSFLQKVIDAPDKISTKFYDRPHMGGSLFPSSKEENVVEISILKETDVMEHFSPPYDIIKCDIEGSEWALLTYYPELLKGTKHLLLEWHSWHQGGGGCNQLLEKITELNFEIINSSPPSSAIERKGEVGIILARNLSVES